MVDFAPYFYNFSPFQISCPHSMKLFYLILSIFILSVSSSQAQSEDSIKSKNPYDLMSNYYDHGFSPFAKKNWYVGLAFSLTDEKFDNTPKLLERVIAGNELNYDLTFKGGYFIGNYVMVGANFIYSRDRFSGQVVQQSTDTLTRQNISSSGRIVPLIKTYFPLTKNHRLSLFNELGFGFGFGNILTRNIRNQDVIEKSFTNEFKFTAGLSPGITFFAIENFCFEVQLNNLIGYELTVQDTKTNETESSRTTKNNVNFSINLLSLNLGLAYYFGAKKP